MSTEETNNMDKVMEQAEAAIEQAKTAMTAQPPATEMVQADPEALESAVNEAAKEVADVAAAMETDEPKQSNNQEVGESQASADTPTEVKEQENVPTMEDAKPKQEEEPKPDAAAAANVENAPTAGVEKAASEEVVNKDQLTNEARRDKEPKKETKKRIRRVGKTTPRKLTKLEDGTTAATIMSPETPATEAAPMTTTTDTMVAAAPAEVALPPDGQASVAPPPVVATHATLPDSIPRVLSKHDEKWNAMFDKLLAFKNENQSTLVPQCFDQDPRLGRWVHYQRVEYWIFQQSGTAKITPERIAKLESIGFEWDPQRAQWNIMFEKLKQFKEEVGHCKVPKGYTKDPELANWVRNQRLEHAHMVKGKRSRMTEDRYKRLDDLGFKWSTTMGAKSPAATKKEDSKEPGTETKTSEEQQQGIVKDEEKKTDETATPNNAEKEAEQVVPKEEDDKPATSNNDNDNDAPAVPQAESQNVPAETALASIAV